ncbi:4-hydroxy-tetrahydrodipicolinate synthase [Sinorhizobium sp. BG8]|nr:4-hydroxy-tetrahydrodipicolinate synthase [Sinorhizobium sp. BG8]
MPTSLRRYLPEGAICDLVTPFRDGEVDRVGLMTLIEWQIRSGISGLVVCGEASEAPTLSREERAAVIGLAADVVDHQVPLLAGTGTNSTETTIGLTRQAQALGADAAVVVTPYYNKPSQEGLFRHFEKLAAAVDLPIIVCNAPGRTAVDLSTRTLERLASIPSIVGVMDCTGDMTRFAGLPPALRDRFRHLSGHDATACPFFLCGGSGSISAGANVAPRLFAAMHSALRTGNVDAAYALQARLNPLVQALEKEGTPAAIKHALSLVLPLSAEVRLPITAAALETQAEIRMALSSLPECGERHRRAG